MVRLEEEPTELLEKGGSLPVHALPFTAQC